MSSPLERALLRLQIFSKGPSLGHFLRLYLTIEDMLNLRLTSRSLRNLAELNHLAFETIYIHTPVPPGREQHVDTLETIANLCQDDVVKIAFDSGLTPSSSLWTESPKRSTPSPSSDTSSRVISGIIDSYFPYTEPPVAWKFVVQRKPGDIDHELLKQWCYIFRLVPNMKTLHIACNGDPAWPGCTDIECLLIMLRIALERSNPRYLRTLRLSPIHAIGIMHLRWAGAGTYGEACASQDSVWQRLEVLHLEIYSPYSRLAVPQKRLFNKIFADYLQSFSKTLVRLNLSWIDAIGPNPFSSGENHPDLRLTRTWSRLQELWLDHVDMNCDISSVRQLAPKLKKLMVSKDVLDMNGEMHKKWSDYLVQREAEKDKNRWMAMRDVQISALPAPLFQSRLV